MCLGRECQISDLFWAVLILPSTQCRWIYFPICYPEVGFFTCRLLRVFLNVCTRRHFSWWTKYNCTFDGVYFQDTILTKVLDVLSAALDSGVAISIVIIFFWYGPFHRLVVANSVPLLCSLQFPKNGAVSTSLSKIDQRMTVEQSRLVPTHFQHGGGE